MSSGGAESGVKGNQAAVVSGRIGCVRDVDSGLGGGTDRQGGRERRTGQRRIQKDWYEDNKAHATLGAEPNIPIPYSLVLEHHHPIMSTLGDPEGRLDRDRTSI